MAAMTLEERLDRIEAMLRVLTLHHSMQGWYSIAEFSRIVGRSEFTCREWCRLGRIQARKQGSGRGAHASWVVSNEELQRYQREGLLRAT